VLELVGFIVGVVSFVAATSIHFYERRRKPECVENDPIRGGGKQRTIAFWRISAFYRTLHLFDDYCDRLEKPRTRARVLATTDTEPSYDDLLRFTEAVLLTAATQILPFSQGKANLFKYVDEPGGSTRRIATHTFIGPFPHEQVLSGNTHYREMELDRDGQGQSVAGDSIIQGGSRLRHIAKTHQMSQHEIELGTTHILGMPAKRDVWDQEPDFCKCPLGSPAAITVDLRIVLTRPLMILIRRFAAYRGAFICHRISRLGKLTGNDQSAPRSEAPTRQHDPSSIPGA
jgi:hypothetical protein